MIHQYRNNGYNIVMDVYSGSVHVVDDVCYDVIAKLNGSETEPTAGTLKETDVKERITVFNSVLMRINPRFIR